MLRVAGLMVYLFIEEGGVMQGKGLLFVDILLRVAGLMAFLLVEEGGVEFMRSRCCFRSL